MPNPTQLTTLANPEQYTILVVDDNQTNLRVIINYLRDFGFKLLMAKDGLMGLKVAQTRKPDLILLDVMMPEIDGFETCQRLKADETTRDIPVIFMTALASEEDKVKGFDVGAVDYVTKPIQQREVLARVITHLRIREQAKRLESQAAELMALNASKDKFFSIMAHDLKSPFQPLLGMAELQVLMADTLTPQNVAEMGQTIYQSAKNIYNLLENLLQWSRIQMERIEYYPKSLDLKDMVETTVQLLTPNATSKNITLQNNIGAFSVYADEQMLDLVIRNLTSNALKFTPTGGLIEFSAREEIENRLVEVAISDNGVGISPEHMAKLFHLDMHHSTVGTAKEHGTGLGLLLCKEMVEKNGGQIWIESAWGKGTTVKFTMPLSH